MTQVLDRVADELKMQARAAAAEFRQLAARIVSGDEPATDTIAATLAATGKTLADLRQQVALVRRRRELRATVDSEPELTARQAELRRAIAVADAEWKLAEDRHDEAVEPFAGELDRVADGLRQVVTARAELFSILDGGSRSKIERLTLQCEAARRQAREAKSLAETLTAEAERVEAKRREALGNISGVADTHSRRLIVQQAETRAAAAKAAAVRSQKTADEAQKAADELTVELRRVETDAIG